MTVHVYGVMRTSHPLLPAATRPVIWHDLAALTNELPVDRNPTERELLDDLIRLSSLVSLGPVVPVRFGTMFADEDTVRSALLARTASRLRAHLDEFDGVAETHVYLRFDEDAALRAVFNSNPAWQEALNRRTHRDLIARIRLGETVAARLVDWRRTRADTLLAPISAVALRSTALPERSHTEDRRAFLIPVEELPTVLAAVDELHQCAGVTVDCVGLLPAYSFLTEPGAEPELEPGPGPGAGAATPATPAATSRWGW